MSSKEIQYHWSEVLVKSTQVRYLYNSRIEVYKLQCLSIVLGDTRRSTTSLPPQPPHHDPPSSSSPSHPLPRPQFPEASIQRITSVGFTREQAVEELQQCNGNPDLALASLLAKSIQF